MQDVQDSLDILLCKDFSIKKRMLKKQVTNLKLTRNLDYKEHTLNLKHVLRLNNLLHFSCLLRQNSCS